MHAPLCHPEAQKRLLECGGGLRFKLCAPVLGQGFFRPSPCFLGSLPVDLFRPLGDVSQDDNLVGRYLQESACHGKYIVGPIMPIVELADLQRSDQGLVPVQDSQIALRSARHHDVRVVL